MRIHYTSDAFSGYVNYEPEFGDAPLQELHEKIVTAIRRKTGHTHSWLHTGCRVALGRFMRDGSMSVHRWVSYTIDPDDLAKLTERMCELDALGPVTDTELGA